MNKKIAHRIGVISLLVCMGGTARADDACWQPAEITAYNITMQTLMIAHVAAACDGVVQANPPLKAQLSDFLSKNQQTMEADRSHLADFFKRAYGPDWQMPMKASLDRENTRVTTMVSKNISADSCAGATQLIHALNNASWQDFVNDAAGQHWADKAGLPACQ
jgi:hypothetical protein